MMKLGDGGLGDAKTLGFSVGKLTNPQNPLVANQCLGKIQSYFGQIIATFPAGNGHPQMVVIVMEFPKMSQTFRLRNSR